MNIEELILNLQVVTYWVFLSTWMLPSKMYQVNFSPKRIQEIIKHKLLKRCNCMYVVWFGWKKFELSGYCDHCYFMGIGMAPVSVLSAALFTLFFSVSLEKKKKVLYFSVLHPFENSCFPFCASSLLWQAGPWLFRCQCRHWRPFVLTRAHYYHIPTSSAVLFFMKKQLNCFKIVKITSKLSLWALFLH